MDEKKPVFVEYNMNQLHLPADLSDWIEPNHIARLVNHVVEEMDISELLETYPGGGRSSYHPKMMLKIILYAYTCQVTSGRRIAKMCQENIPMIWLAGRNQPDFHTINRFRTGKLKDKIGKIFQSLILQIVNSELVDTNNYYLDGTKIEANANKYSFVWVKSVNNYQNRLSGQVQAFLEEAALLAEEENASEPLLSGTVNMGKLAQDILKNVEESQKKTQLK